MPSDDYISEGAPSRAWTLDSRAFERLLAALDEDRERAATAYEQLRHRIAGLMRWWGAHDAEALADETLDRMARKLDGGAVIEDGSIGAYARGVARMIYYEWTRRPRPNHDDIGVVAAPGVDSGEPAAACFDRCLARLPDEDRRLVLAYYDDGKAKDVRRRLAVELGITITALRLRVHRLRERLERCVKACLEAA